MLALITSCDKISPSQEGGETSGSYIFFEPEVLEGIDVKSLLTGKEFPSDEGTAFGAIGYYSEPQDDNTIKLTNIFTSATEKVYRKEAGKSFVYDNLALWKPSINHVFYGFYPHGLQDKNLVKLNNGSPYIEYTQPTTMDNMVDILTAKRELTQAAATNNSVDLTFTHSLWALDIIVINNQTENPYNPGTGTLDPYLYIESATLTLVNIPSGGKLNLDGNNTVDSRSNITYTLHSSTSNNITLGKKDSESSSHNFGPFLFFPTNIEIDESQKVQYRLDFKFKNPWGISYDFSYPANADSYADFTVTKFNAGSRYQLTITKKEGDSFTVKTSSEIPWNNEEINHEFK